MKNNQKYSFKEFITDLKKYPSGWVTWETRKSYHLKPEILSYINENFIKYNGNGIDKTGIEIYYFSDK